MKGTMTQTQHRLINYLKEYCYGKSNAISKDRLASYFNITTRELRDIKRDIVINNSIPIGSTKAGYFYAASDLEIMNFRNEHLSRLTSHREMIDAYEIMIAQKDQLQMI